MYSKRDAQFDDAVPRMSTLLAPHRVLYTSETGRTEDRAKQVGLCRSCFTLTNLLREVKPIDQGSSRVENG